MVCVCAFSFSCLFLQHDVCWALILYTDVGHCCMAVLNSVVGIFLLPQDLQVLLECDLACTYVLLLYGREGAFFIIFSGCLVYSC